MISGFKDGPSATLFFINRAAVVDPHHQHNSAVSLDFADHAVVPHPVTPQTRQIISYALTSLARITVIGSDVIKVLSNPSGILWIQLRQLTLGGGGELKFPSQDY